MIDGPVCIVDVQYAVGPSDLDWWADVFANDVDGFHASISKLPESHKRAVWQAATNAGLTELAEEAQYHLTLLF